MRGSDSLRKERDKTSSLPLVHPPAAAFPDEQDRHHESQLFLPHTPTVEKHHSQMHSPPLRSPLRHRRDSSLPASPEEYPDLCLCSGCARQLSIPRQLWCPQAQPRAALKPASLRGLGQLPGERFTPQRRQRAGCVSTSP